MKGLKIFSKFSLLLICGNTYEHFSYIRIFYFFIKNNLVSTDQSALKLRDSCTHQLLAITHDIYKSSNVGLKVRSVFLLILEAFGNVWYKGL